MLLQALAEVLFTLQDPALDEVSGLALGAEPGTYVVAEDSGEDLRFATVDGTGRTTSVTRFPGVDVRDLEDLARGPDATLHLADIGDNSASRPRVLLRRVPAGGGPDALETASLTYEDGASDAEALLVHPRTGQTLLVTKGVLGAGVYEAPLPFGDGVLRRVGEVQTTATGTPGGPGIGGVAQVLVTGGAVSPDGRRIAVRTYTDAYLYDVPGEDLVEALRGRPTVVPLPETRQGEAVTWTADGSALVTATEGARGPVHRVPVPPAPAPAQPPPDAAPEPAGEPEPVPRETPPWVLPAAAAGVLLLVGAAAARRRSSR